MQPRRLMVLATIVAAIPGSPGTALAAPPLNSDCHALKLVAASGVPAGQKRSYTFSGTCNVISDLPTGPLVHKTVPAEASATWDPAKKELSESFRVLAPFGGTAKATEEGGSVLGVLPAGADTTWLTPWQIKPLPVTSRFACNDDPLVTAAACGLLEHRNDSGFAPFSNPAQKLGRPLLKGKTTLAEATQLSAQAKPFPPAVGTLPAPSPGTAPPPFDGDDIEYEAEALHRQALVQSSGGGATVQPMAGFGDGWSGNEQLFWQPPGAGATLDLAVQVPSAGTWRIELYMTRAPDYGSLLVHVGPKPAVGFDGFSKGVTPSGAFQAGVHQLPAGVHQIRFKVLGKNPASGGHRVGIDRIRLTRVQRGAT